MTTVQEHAAKTALRLADELGWLDGTKEEAEAFLAGARQGFLAARCNAEAPDGSGLLCDREPGHDGRHASWQASEWRQVQKAPAQGAEQRPETGAGA